MGTTYLVFCFFLEGTYLVEIKNFFVESIEKKLKVSWIV